MVGNATMGQQGLLPRDLDLSALIDDELPEPDAERLRSGLAVDNELAHRFAVMSEATDVIRASYRDAIDVIVVMRHIHLRVIRDARNAGASGLGHGARSATARAAFGTRDVDRAVACLSSEHRNALCLVVLEDLSYVEAAAALRLAQGQVMWKLAEARRMVASCLAGRQGAHSQH